MFWFYVLPLGFLLTQYTITGFDSSAHISEETHGAAESAAEGRLALGLLLGGHRLDRAAGDHVRGARPEAQINEGGGTGRSRSFENALGTAWVKFVLLICVVGQLFCGMACMTSASRMMYAFSRDGAMPGWRIWSRVNQRRVPFDAVMFMAVVRADHHAARRLHGQQATACPVAFTRGRVDRASSGCTSPT